MQQSGSQRWIYIPAKLLIQLEFHQETIHCFLCIFHILSSSLDELVFLILPVEPANNELTDIKLQDQPNNYFEEINKHHEDMNEICI